MDLGFSECGVVFKLPFSPSNPDANVLMNSLLGDTCSTAVYRKSEGNDQ